MTGNDYVQGGSGIDTINGGPGNDTLISSFVTAFRYHSELENWNKKSCSVYFCIVSLTGDTNVKQY